MPSSAYAASIKPVLDWLMAFLLLLVLGIPLIAVALLIKLDSRGPAFFFQDRVGYQGKTIRLIKLRSMTHRPDRVPGEAGELLGDEPEITRVGRFIRRFRIDEWPNLFNVLKGEMALVGPRPCLVYMKKEFDAYGRRRLDVLPGCTGLAQTHGAIHLPWPQRWRYDAYYVDHISLLLDVHILLRTLVVVLHDGKKHLVEFDRFLATRDPDWSLKQD